MLHVEVNDVYYENYSCVSRTGASDSEVADRLCADNGLEAEQYGAYDLVLPLSEHELTPLPPESEKRCWNGGNQRQRPSNFNISGSS